MQQETHAQHHHHHHRQQQQEFKIDDEKDASEQASKQARKEKKASERKSTKKAASYNKTVTLFWLWFAKVREKEGRRGEQLFSDNIDITYLRSAQFVTKKKRATPFELA